MNYKAQTIKILFKIIDFRIKQNWNNWERKGIVKYVDEIKRTCIVTIDGLDYTEIALQSINGLTTGFVLLPLVGSQVAVNKTGEFYYISLFSQISKVICNADLVQFNGGTLNGMVKVEPLHSRIKVIEDKVNSLINILKTMSVTLAPSGVFPLGTTYFSSSSPIPTANKSDIINTKITQ